MNEARIVAAGPADAQALSALAFAIWREHYAGILPEGQVEYMIHRFQSPQAIADQMQEGYCYCFIMAGQRQAGYLAYRLDADGLFVSKLYVAKAFRRQGLGRTAMDFLAAQAQKAGADKLWLTVNRGNAASIAAYRAYGFVVVRQQDSDIGQGYAMQDYVMERTL